MAHEVIWTDRLTSLFIEKAMLSEEEAFIIKTRARGYTTSYQADYLGCSVQTVHRMVAKLKQKYDVVQSEFPDEFPKRKISKTETFMDEN